MAMVCALAEDAGDVGVAVAVVVHGFAAVQRDCLLVDGAADTQLLSQSAGRFSRKAPMPSLDSACSMFSTITPAA